MTEPRVWLITGATSGFGLALAKAALGRGDIVVGAARSPDRLADLVAEHPHRLFAVELDVTDAAAGRAVLDGVVATHGRIDVLVNNAGRTQVGALEETTEDELRALFDLHVFGPALLTRAALPHMRAQGGGMVVQMSSVGGQVTGPGFGVYCATKFALEGLTETLAQEVDFGVRFLIVEPGAFRTGLFRPGAAVESMSLPEYAATVGPTRDFLVSGDGAQPGDPDKAARAILAALESAQPPLRLVLGADAIDSIRTRWQGMAEELTRWEQIGRDTALA